MVTKAQEQRVAKQLDKAPTAAEVIARNARLRAELRETQKQAEALGVSLKSERKLASGPANGQLLAVEYGTVEGHTDPVLVFTVALADGSKQSGDGRAYLLNLSGSEVMEIAGIGKVTLGSLWMLEGEPAKKAAK